MFPFEYRTVFDVASLLQGYRMTFTKSTHPDRLEFMLIWVVFRRFMLLASNSHLRWQPIVRNTPTTTLPIQKHVMYFLFYEMCEVIAQGGLLINFATDEWRDSWILLVKITILPAQYYESQLIPRIFIWVVYELDTETDRFHNLVPLCDHFMRTWPLIQNAMFFFMRCVRWLPREGSS